MDYALLKRNWKTLIFLLYVLLLVGGSTYYMLMWASRVNDYMGDEVWYVPATRNVLARLGINVHYVNGSYEGVNVILKEPEYRGEVRVSFLGLTITGKYRNYPHVPEFARRLGIRVEIIPYNVSTLDSAHFDSLKLKVWEIANRCGFKDYVPYQNFPGVYYEIPTNCTAEFVANVSRLGNLSVVTGFRYPDKENIHRYLNTEHPFLGKDIIALGMLLGDKPIFWRLPGIIEHIIIDLVVLYVAYRLTKSYLAAGIALLFVALDPLLFATSIVAMLDIHVAFFVSLFLLTLTLNRDRLSGLTLGLATATKLSGAFVFPVLWIKLIRKGSVKEFLISGILLPAAGFLLPELPIIKAMGFVPWLQEFLASFSWHLSFKGEHPASSPFWMWFISLKPFPFHYSPDVYAVTDPILMLSMVAFIFAIPYAARRQVKLAEIFGAFWSVVVFFALQWILGGKTQFIFYATPLVPPGAIVLGVLGHDIIRWEYFEESLRIYWRWIRGILKEIRARIGRG
ncbi:dolichyl-phosphate-mannose--protein mannosyltransferase [Pyrococcus yayanosii]|uniref:Dolichyl-phosphate-mannose-protein mannosyltransferase n=1 Tax=Pyrococcus yayanosii (strain CH1 / JCM 16557) TaxID=529709 RepID=F8AGA5_PYRYC|nr:dolichyl-phosphate-mannose--protein mannosyltransferase [Pyrococcus yayanosii]AEH23942.1 dolichyl-phosphate-mannose-protein mannosyltransferase [Pyrococcus yayanosii CH1]